MVALIYETIFVLRIEKAICISACGYSLNKVH